MFQTNKKTDFQNKQKQKHFIQLLKLRRTLIKGKKKSSYKSFKEKTARKRAKNCQVFFSVFLINNLIRAPKKRLLKKGS